MPYTADTTMKETTGGVGGGGDYIGPYIDRIDTYLVGAAAGLYDVEESAYAAPTNGTTDATAAFQAALVAANAAGGGTVRALRPIAYSVAPLTIGSNTTLLLGPGTVLSARTGTYAAGTYLLSLKAVTTRRVIIEGGMLQGNYGIANLGGIGFVNTGLTSDAHHQVRFHRVEGFTLGIGVFFGANVRESTILRTYIQDCAQGVYVIGTDNKLLHVVSAATGGHGIVISGSNNDLVMCKAFYAGYSGTAFTAASDGIRVAALAGDSLRAVKLTACEGQENGRHGIAFHADAGYLTHCVATTCLGDSNNATPGANGSGLAVLGTTATGAFGAAPYPSAAVQVVGCAARNNAGLAGTQLWGLDTQGDMTGTEIVGGDYRNNASGPIAHGTAYGYTARLTGTATYDPPSVAAGAQTTTTVAIAGARPGDPVIVGFGNTIQGMQLTGYVSATGTVTAVFRNGTAAAIDLASGTLRATVFRAD